MGGGICGHERDGLSFSLCGLGGADDCKGAAATDPTGLLRP
jgi:hypothetical protein